jgi:tetratricopeptide (TPR) repeat protein
MAIKTFYVTAGAPADGNGSEANPFSSIQEALDYADFRVKREDIGGVRLILSGHFKYEGSTSLGPGELNESLMEKNMVNAANSFIYIGEETGYSIMLEGKGPGDEQAIIDGNGKIRVIGNLACIELVLGKNLVITGGMAWFGGGICNASGYSNSILIVDGADIHGNTALSGGSALYCQRKLSIKDGFIHNNICNIDPKKNVVMRSGYIFPDTAVYSDGEAYITGGTIADNNSRGFWQFSEKCTISGGVIENNSGGGLYIASPAELLMTGGIIRNNSAVNGGGILFNGQDTDGNVYKEPLYKLEGGEIYGNKAKRGGGLYISQAFVTVKDCPIENNSAETGEDVFIGNEGFLFGKEGKGVYIDTWEDIVNDCAGRLPGTGAYIDKHEAALTLTRIGLKKHLAGKIWYNMAVFFDNYHYAYSLRAQFSQYAHDNWKTVEIERIIHDLEAAIKTAPTGQLPIEGDYYYQLGLVYLYGKKDKDAARTQFEKALELNPKHHGAQDFIVYLSRGSKRSNLVNVTEDPYILGKIADEDKTQELCDIAMRKTLFAAHVLELVPERFKTEEMCINCGRLLCFPEKWKTFEACAQAVRESFTFRDIPEKFKTYQFCLYALNFQADIIPYTPEACKTPELLLRAVQKWAGNLQYLPDDMKTPDICMKAVSAKGGMLEYVPDTLITEEMCLRAFLSETNRSVNLDWVPEQFKTVEICKAAVRARAQNLEYVPDVLKDRDMCLLAIKNDGTMLKFVPEKKRTKAMCEAALKTVSAPQYISDCIPKDFIADLRFNGRPLSWYIK